MRYLKNLKAAFSLRRLLCLTMSLCSSVLGDDEDAGPHVQQTPFDEVLATNALGKKGDGPTSLFSMSPSSFPPPSFSPLLPSSPSLSGLNIRLSPPTLTTTAASENPLGFSLGDESSPPLPGPPYLSRHQISPSPAFPHNNAWHGSLTGAGQDANNTSAHQEMEEGASGFDLDQPFSLDDDFLMSLLTPPPSGKNGQ